MRSLDDMLVERFIWNYKFGGVWSVACCRRLYEEKVTDFYIRVKRSFNKPYHSLDISSPAIEIFNLILDDPNRFSCENTPAIDNPQITPSCIKDLYLTLTDKITGEKFKFLGYEESYYLLTAVPFTEDEKVVLTAIFKQWCESNLKTPREIERERLTKIYCKEI